MLGWAWKCSEFVFLERNFDKDKEVINRQITELSEHPDPMWVSTKYIFFYDYFMLTSMYDKEIIVILKYVTY